MYTFFWEKKSFLLCCSLWAEYRDAENEREKCNVSLVLCGFAGPFLSVRIYSLKVWGVSGACI